MKEEKKETIAKTNETNKTETSSVWFNHFV